MNIKVVLFDLDGTLLPMDQDEFIKAYLGLLTEKFVPYGYEPDKLVRGIWTGTSAMVANKGEQSNEEVFWDTFTGICGAKVKEDMELFDAFYRNEFAGVKNVCGYNPEAAKTVQRLKEKGFRVALATNPIFPKIATESRIRWTGLKPEDFELYTTYEASHYCKPNPGYYQEIMENMGAQPEECLMVGNDVTEDMIAETLGMQVFLLTDCIINKEKKDISKYSSGSFPQLWDYMNLM